MALYQDVANILNNIYFVSFSSEDISNIELINAYVRVLKIYNSDNTDAPEIPLDQHNCTNVAMNIRKKYIHKCLRLLGLEYIAPKLQDIIDKRKALRIILALHDKTVARYGKELGQRVNLVIKKEQLLMKKKETKEKKTIKPDYLLQTEFLSKLDCPKEAESSRVASKPSNWKKAELPLKAPRPPSKPISSVPDFKIPIGRQIPRTPLKAELQNGGVDCPIQMPFLLSPPSEYQDEANNPTPLEGTFTLSSPKPDRMDMQFPKSDTTQIIPSKSNADCDVIPDKNNRDFTPELPKDKKENDHRKTYAIVQPCDDLNWASPISTQNGEHGNIGHLIITPPDNFNDETSQTHMKDAPSSPYQADDKRISDIAPLGFDDSLPELHSMQNQAHLKNRETFVVGCPKNDSCNPKPSAHMRETYVIPPKGFGSPLEQTTDNFIETTKNLKFESSNSFSDFDSINGDRTTLYKSITQNETFVVQKIGDKSIVAVKKEPGKKILVKKTKISEEEESTLITEISYAAEATKNTIPSGRMLPRTPPSKDSDLHNISNIHCGGLAPNCSKNDMRIQIFVKERDKTKKHVEEKNMDTKKQVSDKSLIFNDSSLKYEDSFSLFPIQKSRVPKPVTAHTTDHKSEKITERRNIDQTSDKNNPNLLSVKKCQTNTIPKSELKKLKIVSDNLDKKCPEDISKLPLLKDESCNPATVDAPFLGKDKTTVEGEKIQLPTKLLPDYDKGSKKSQIKKNSQKGNKNPQVAIKDEDKLSPSDEMDELQLPPPKSKAQKGVKKTRGRKMIAESETNDDKSEKERLTRTNSRGKETDKPKTTSKREGPPDVASKKDLDIYSEGFVPPASMEAADTKKRRGRKPLTKTESTEAKGEETLTTMPRKTSLRKKKEEPPKMEKLETVPSLPIHEPAAENTNDKKTRGRKPLAKVNSNNADKKNIKEKVLRKNTQEEQVVSENIVESAECAVLNDGKDSGRPDEKNDHASGSSNKETTSSRRKKHLDEPSDSNAKAKHTKVRRTASRKKEESQNPESHPEPASKTVEEVCETRPRKPVILEDKEKCINKKKPPKKAAVKSNFKKLISIFEEKPGEGQAAAAQIDQATDGAPTHPPSKKETRRKNQKKENLEANSSIVKPNPGTANKLRGPLRETQNEDKKLKERLPAKTEIGVESKKTKALNKENKSLQSSKDNLNETVNSLRPSRRCKVKASSAIFDGFNDSLY